MVSKDNGLLFPVALNLSRVCLIGTLMRGGVCGRTTKSSKDFTVSNGNGKLSDKAEKAVFSTYFYPKCEKNSSKMVILMEADETNFIRVSLKVTKEQ